jgi:DNA-binding transcriptional MerR regulator
MTPLGSDHPGAYRLNGSAPADEGEGDGVAAAGAAAPDAARSRLKKAPNAFRTISEVADELHIPQHVLRFWESKFPQVKPLKRGGGRRYYRPDDIALLRRISDLLYIQGYTIKGVQRLLREGGGRLSDDIPPATPDEQAEAAAERHAVIEPEEPQLPMIGLDPPDSPTPQSHARTPRTMAGTGADAGAEAELSRLRGALRDVLRELEAVRALLP